MSMDSFVNLFAKVVESGVGYVITWRVGIYIVNTLVEWITGGSNEL